MIKLKDLLPEKFASKAQQGYMFATNPDAAKKYKIYAVPTLVIFNEGEEVDRFSPNIMFETDATREEIQEAIDEEVMSDF